jgi:hypothetical protein
MLLDRNLLNDYSMPSGLPEEWDCIDEVKGHYLAREFAREYLADFDSAGALYRMGYMGPDANKMSRDLLKHPLVSNYQAEFMRDLSKQHKICDDSIVSLLWMEAQDRSFGSSGRSRIAALKELITLRQKLGISDTGVPATEDEEDAEEEEGKRMPHLSITIRTKPREEKGAELL